MYFDKLNLEAIRAFLEEKWPLPRTCGICRTNPDHWRVSEMPVLLPLLIGGRIFDLTDLGKAAEHVAVAPAVALTCSNCGHIVFFSATNMHLVQTEIPEHTRFKIPSE